MSILLPSLDLDISLTGFEFGEIDVLLADIGDEKPAPEDRPPPTAGAKVARGGDLWILRQHRVLCGDAREASDYCRESFKTRVKPLQFDAGVGGSELPICLGVTLVAVFLPGGDFDDQGLLVRDAAAQALG